MALSEEGKKALAVELGKFDEMAEDQERVVQKARGDANAAQKIADDKANWLDLQEQALQDINVKRSNLRKDMVS
jgi:hypothetical protein